MTEIPATRVIDKLVARIAEQERELAILRTEVEIRRESEHTHEEIPAPTFAEPERVIVVPPQE